MKFCTGGDKVSVRVLEMQYEGRGSLCGDSKWLSRNEKGGNAGRWETLMTSCFYFALCLNPVPTNS